MLQHAHCVTKGRKQAFAASAGLKDAHYEQLTFADSGTV